MIFGWLRNRKRKKALSEVWLEDWSLFLNRNVRLSWDLSDIELSRLQDRVKIFVAEKNWEGIDGLDVTEEMKVTVAAQACLMILGVDNFYFDNVHSILMYPKSFSRVDSETGAVHHRAGEAWQGGPIILSWKDVLRGGRDEDDGTNLVVHEFAHALDGLDGEMGGQVVFDDPATTKRWMEVVDEEYTELCNAKTRGISTLLDHYGATNKAEFFAVASETFFEQPRRLKSEKTELYGLLEKYYRVDPLTWQQPERSSRQRRRQLARRQGRTG